MPCWHFGCSSRNTLGVKSPCSIVVLCGPCWTLSSRLPLAPKRTASVLDRTCQQCPAVSVWQLATCVISLCSEQGSGGWWWRVAGIYISGPCNVQKLEPQVAVVGKWECVKQNNSWNFFSPAGREAKAECQMPQKCSYWVVYSLESLARVVLFLSPWEEAWLKRSKV